MKYILVQQFEIDLSYFYNTLKSAVIYKGQNCVTNERWRKDGIVVYKNLLIKFKYGGDIKTYKSKLLHILHNTKYYTGYKGDTLAFVENFETTLAEYNKVVEIETNIINDQLAM